MHVTDFNLINDNIAGEIEGLGIEHKDMSQHEKDLEELRDLEKQQDEANRNYRQSQEVICSDGNIR